MIISAENLGKRFNREWIFRNFNHSFDTGVYAITGPNGSGKSTLLQVLWGQLPASDGQLNFFDKGVLIPIEEVYKNLVIATPYLELIEEFTLTELLRFHFSFKKTRNGISIEELIENLELLHARDKTINHFSSGMKQRLKLGLAFFSDVEIVFLDEPTTNLDKQAIGWYWKNFNLIKDKATVFIGSNLENEYPVNAVKIDLLRYK